MNFQEKLQLAYQKIKTAKNILLIAHTSPDADAISSIGAMIELMKKWEIDFYAYTHQKVNQAYNFIPNESFVTSEEPQDLKVFDVILILDCGQLSRTKLEKEIGELLERPIRSRPYIIEFDHHLPQETYADLELRYPKKASTTEIIYHFFKVNDLLINKKVAECILIGLITDTDHFFHSNASQESLAIASEMLLLGASLPRIISHTAHNRNFHSLKIWGRVLDNMIFRPETGFIISALTQEEIEELLPAESVSSEKDLFGDIVSFLNSLAGVRVALLLREVDGYVKGSLRTSLDTIDVAKIANRFGGGGHKKAAGFTIPGHLKKTNTGWKVIQ